MTRYYIPYSGKHPASFEIKGHKLILLARDKGSIEHDLDTVGADRLKMFRVGDSEIDEEQFLAKIAEKNAAGVLILPAETSYTDLMKSLEDQLPWLQ